MSVVFAGLAASLDGFIASKSGDLSWLNDALAPGEDYGCGATERRTGAYIMGANAYREVAGNSGGSARTPTYVVTHQQDLKRPGKNVTFYSGDLRGACAAGEGRDRQGHLPLRRR